MPCNQCNGRCCQRFVVYITAHDAARIVKAMPHLEPTSFLTPYPAVLDPIHPIIKLKGKDFVLGLDSKKGTAKDCRFLLDVGNSRICGIYEKRPMGCRSYPFTLKKNTLRLAEPFVCPQQWFPDGEERELYIGTIRQFNKELKEYGDIAEKWNRNFGKRGSFIEFLHFMIEEVNT